MPYVEGFGTWPFGEEWLWEAIATSYVPLLELLGHAPMTLSLTPVLCDQLDAPGAIERCLSFLREVRPASHELDIVSARAAGDRSAVAELKRSSAEYAAAADRLASIEREGGLMRALGAHASWTSSATHAIMPLLATDAGIGLQLRTGIAAHRRRFGEWGGGLWLPECAYAPWLDAPLEAAGVRASCVELTATFGLGDDRHLGPLHTHDGPLLWPIDRQQIALVWSEDGYPSHAAYRDDHALTVHHHRVLANDGGAYEFERARAQALLDARDFVQRVRRRVRGGGLCVCAFDTELFGHHWYEGVFWLTAVIEQAREQGLSLTALDDDAAARHRATPAPDRLGVSSWGEGEDLRTWSAPAAAAFAWQARTGELAVLAHGSRPNDRALRELLALQASDWAFLHSRAWAGDYPRERAQGHLRELRRALASGGSGTEGEQALHGLAPVLDGWEG
jgi:1,4-alpha-glucan branching enzyme